MLTRPSQRTALMRSEARRAASLVIRVQESTAEILFAVVSFSHDVRSSCCDDRRALADRRC
jgi:hypothetical protein